jgi:hypothetical protein
MINDPLSPRASKLCIVTAGQNDGVFDRNNALVVVTIQSPGLQLPARKAALMHQQVEGMPVMIPFAPDLLHSLA